jgi:hypothetical protein
MGGWGEKIKMKKGGEAPPRLSVGGVIKPRDKQRMKLGGWVGRDNKRGAVG